MDKNKHEWSASLAGWDGPDTDVAALYRAEKAGGRTFLLRVAERHTATVLDDPDFNTLATEILRLAGEVERLERHLAESEEAAEAQRAVKDAALRAFGKHCTELESEVRHLREMNEAQLKLIEARDRALDETNRDLDEARENGLSLGNAALKKGWEDCEKAVVTYIRGTYMTREGLARTIEEGRHRPRDFDAHAPAWTGADELTPEEVMARCDPFPNGEPFAYPAGLPEEDPGSAPEETEQARLRSLHELAQAARLYPELFFAQHTLAKLREADVIPGE